MSERHYEFVFFFIFERANYSWQCWLWADDNLYLKCCLMIEIFSLCTLSQWLSRLWNLVSKTAHEAISLQNCRTSDCGWELIWWSLSSFEKVPVLWTLYVWRHSLPFSLTYSIYNIVKEKLCTLLWVPWRKGGITV